MNILNDDRDQNWQPYAADPEDLSDLHSRVHVWRARIDHLPQDPRVLLSDDEKARADRFHRDEDRNRFMAARAVLRQILTDCLDRAHDLTGRMLRFGYGAYGKPYLLDDPRLRFNVSHSEDLIVIAATRAGEVGVDIERQRLMKDMDGVARLIFNDAERAAILACPPASRPMVFYRIWTHKEALIKAMGAGLIALDDSNGVSLMRASANWLLMALPHLDGYLASLARPRSTHGIKLWSWPNAVGMRSGERRKMQRPMPSQPRTSYGREVRA